MSNIGVVDLFCGAAGLSYGLKQSGLDILAGIDLDPACRYPFETNVGAEFIERDIRSVTAPTLLTLFGSAQIRVLAGCAPCQPFSGYTTKRRATDGRWELLLEFLRLVKQTRPEIVTLENVPRLSHLPLWSDFVSGLQGAGYYVTWSVLDLSNFGVPQQRRRLVLLGSQLGQIELPTANKGKPRTVRSAIGRLPAIEAGGKHARDTLHATRALTATNLARIKRSKQAGTWRQWPEEMRAACHQTERGKTYPSVYGRMSWDKPAPTITTQFYGFGNGRFGHPEQHRAISLREGALLQSFPRDFEFVPKGKKLSFKEVGRLIGNAVPPALGMKIGQAILRHVEAVGQRK
ncbi:DNA cytosine methyltransferase [Bradyrhizobium sp. SEMIA]|uniref:DNA cytosine methyltransferase n=1 Tax=Bradyrhizobium sp. SEMIA TaxID=2597515 RepID=UPI0018A4A3BA|nr:DNA cytosine methyltransferase [Bradyrhizobium sp. SEMIA]QOG20824.1 DNA (cytosine-5-)-methyltransferase [Bradyrhizobium sp. SEMIA]